MKMTTADIADRISARRPDLDYADCLCMAAREGEKILENVAGAGALERQDAGPIAEEYLTPTGLEGVVGPRDMAAVVAFLVAHGWQRSVAIARVRDYGWRERLLGLPSSSTSAESAWNITRPSQQPAPKPPVANPTRQTLKADEDGATFLMNTLGLTRTEAQGRIDAHRIANEVEATAKRLATRASRPLMSTADIAACLLRDHPDEFGALPFEDTLAFACSNRAALSDVFGGGK